MVPRTLGKEDEKEAMVHSTAHLEMKLSLLTPTSPHQISQTLKPTMLASPSVDSQDQRPPVHA